MSKETKRRKQCQELGHILGMGYAEGRCLRCGMTGLIDARTRRLSEIADALARPVEEGPEWDKRRAELEAEEAALLQRRS